MKRLSKVQQAIKYFKKDGIKISANNKYFPLKSVAAKYFGLNEAEFIAAYPGMATKINTIAPGKLLKCLEKTEEGRAIIDKIEGKVTEKTQDIIKEAAVKSKDLIKTVTVDSMINEMNFSDEDESKKKSIKYAETTLESINETDPGLFYLMSGCPKGTLTIMKNLNVTVYKVNSINEFVIDYVQCKMIFGKSLPNGSRVYESDDEALSNYSIINSDLIENAMGEIASNALAYSFQLQMKQMHPDRFKKLNDVPDVKKRTEYQALHYLYLKLSPNFIFKYQVKVGSYYIDCLMIPKGLSKRNMIDISIEIDENGHADRDPIKEKQRENFIRAAGFEVYRIPVKTDLPTDTIRKIIDEESEKLIKMIKKSFVFSSPDLILKMIKEYVIDNNVHNEFISLFFRETTPGNPFVYTHEDIGKYLGFNKDQNYRKLTELIRNCCTEDVDYVIINKDGKNHYNVTRLGFNYICSAAKTPLSEHISRVFARVYELTTQLTLMIASGVPNSVKLTAQDKSCVIESEILKYVNNKQNADNSVLKQLTEENDDIKNRLNNVTDALNVLQVENGKLMARIAKLVDEARDLKEELEDSEQKNRHLRKKVKELEKSAEEADAELQKMKQKMIKLERENRRLIEEREAISKKNNSKSSVKKRVVKKS